MGTFPQCDTREVPEGENFDMEFRASNSTQELFVERRWDGGRKSGSHQRHRMLMAVGLMVGAAAFFAVGFFAAGTGKDLKDGTGKDLKDGSAKQEMDVKENAGKDEEYDYS